MKGIQWRDLRRLLLLACFAYCFLPALALAATQLFTTPGTFVFTVPSGVSSINVVVVGGGGGGGGGNGSWGGGSGGGCGGGVAGTTLSVTPGQTFTVTVGAGGVGGTASFLQSTNGQPGGSSSFGSIKVIGGSYGGTGYYVYPNTYGPPGGAGGGSGGGGGGNGDGSMGGYAYFDAPATSGGTAGNNTPLPQAQTAYGWFYSASNPPTGYCTGSGWTTNQGTLGSLITQVPWSAGQGGQVGSGDYYYGGGGGGGLVIDSSTVSGATGGTEAGESGPNYTPGPGGAGYGGGGGGTDLAYYATGGKGAPGVVYVEWVGQSSCSTDTLLCVQTCSDGSQADEGICSSSAENGQCSLGETLVDGQCLLSCAAGDLYENNSCVVSCDTGYEEQGDQCVFNGCPAGYAQQTDQNGNLECTLSACPSGYALEDDSCVYTGQGLTNGETVPVPSVALWQVLPTLVQSGETASVSWKAQNVISCNVTGSNGDGTGSSNDKDADSPGVWSGASGVESSSHITGQTVYTITCDGEAGSSPSSVTQSTTVNIVPAYEEQ